ncbi:MAG TPA: histidinol-phosphate transaminase [Rhizomicrobium sp.]
MTTDHIVMPARGVLAIAAYQAGAQTAPDIADPARLASNEAALGPSLKVVEALRQASSRIDRYPDPSCGALRLAIAKAYGLDADNIVCGSGSEALIHVAMRSYVSAGDEVVLPARAFSVGRIAAQSCGADIVAVPERDDLEIDVDRILAAATRRTKLIYLPNPNNPTGVVVSATDIRRLRAGLPDHAMLFLDAAYREYVEEPDYSSGDELVGTDRGNVVVSSTFSKIYALAGLRLGWVHASRDIVAILNRVRPAFGVSLPAQIAAIAALNDVEHVAREKAVIRAQRARMIAALTALGFRTGRSPANFVPVHVPDRLGDAAELNAFLTRRGVLVRPAASYGLPRMLRVTVGNAHDTGRALDGFADWARRAS